MFRNLELEFNILIWGNKISCLILIFFGPISSFAEQFLLSFLSPLNGENFKTMTYLTKWEIWFLVLFILPELLLLLIKKQTETPRSIAPCTTTYKFSFKYCSCASPTDMPWAMWSIFSEQAEKEKGRMKKVRKNQQRCLALGTKEKEM